MEAVAKLNNVPTPARKMRLLADLIRGESVDKAIAMLKLQQKNGAPKLEKLLLSAISNWQHKNSDQSIDESGLYIKKIYVDNGRMLKRLQPAPQGRAHRIRKRSNHVTVVVDSRNTAEDTEEEAVENQEADDAQVEETANEQKENKAKV